MISGSHSIHDSGISLPLQTGAEVRIGRGGRLHRRDFLSLLAGAGTAAGALGLPQVVSANAAELKKDRRACILLWMQGGPSQFETFAPKPGHANGGETKGIATSVAGIEIGEHLPEVARCMKDICLMRAVNSREGSHPRATYLMHTGYLPTASVKNPSLGSVVAKEIGETGFALPSYVRIGSGARSSGMGGGFLGVEYDGFALQSAHRMPDNTQLGTSALRFERRLELLDELSGEYAAEGGLQEVNDHKKLYDKAARLVLSPNLKAFDLTQESERQRAAYGTGEFGAGCLLARRLVEAGVSFVEVNLGNWDTHQDNVAGSKRLCEQLDKPYAALLSDLRARGLLERTLVIWMGEFGRTPRINARGGRDHYPKAFSVCLSGSGIRGGQVIGSTDAGGEEVRDRPVEVKDLLRTVCQSLNINADKEYHTPIGRPLKIVDGGSVVKEALG